MGEEVYFMVIMLYEEGLYDKVCIYVIDMNDCLLQQVKEGVYGIEKMKLYIINYLEVGGIRVFFEYYIVKYNFVMFYFYL